MIGWAAVALLLSLGVEPIEARVINQNGTNFVCLLPDDAQRLLQLRLDFPILQNKIKKYEELVVVQEKENERITNAASDLSDQLGIENQVNEILRSALSMPEPWYKRPTFWAMAGVVLGAATAVLIYEWVDSTHNAKTTTVY
jgi:hypothetical protein